MNYTTVLGGLLAASLGLGRGLGNPALPIVTYDASARTLDSSPTHGPLKVVKAGSGNVLLMERKQDFEFLVKNVNPLSDIFVTRATSIALPDRPIPLQTLATPTQSQKDDSGFVPDRATVLLILQDSTALNDVDGGKPVSTAERVLSYMTGYCDACSAIEKALKEYNAAVAAHPVEWSGADGALDSTARALETQLKADPGTQPSAQATLARLDEKLAALAELCKKNSGAAGAHVTADLLDRLLADRAALRKALSQAQATLSENRARAEARAQRRFFVSGAEDGSPLAIGSQPSGLDQRSTLDRSVVAQVEVVPRALWGAAAFLDPLRSDRIAEDRPPLGVAFGATFHYGDPTDVVLGRPRPFVGAALNPNEDWRLALGLGFRLRGPYHATLIDFGLIFGPVRTLDPGGASTSRSLRLAPCAGVTFHM